MSKPTCFKCNELLALHETCTRCNGAGEILVSSFVDFFKKRRCTCPVCFGSGKIENCIEVLSKQIRQLKTEKEQLQEQKKNEHQQAVEAEERHLKLYLRMNELEKKNDQLWEIIGGLPKPLTKPRKIPNA